MFVQQISCLAQIASNLKLITQGHFNIQVSTLQKSCIFLGLSHDVHSLTAAGEFPDTQSLLLTVNK